MPDVKARFAPGGARPAPATTYAAPRTEIFPGIDRPTMVLWLGVALIAASELLDYGPIASVVDAAQGKQVKSNSIGVRELIVELGLVGFLYLLAMASDNSGTVAVLILVALWLMLILRHPGPVQAVLSLSQGLTKNTKGA